MMVSIIIPAYNAAKYIEECVQSALDQTYQNTEIIVVNDGSTDNTLQILENFSDKIKIMNKKNGGTASALNVGIKTMKGEWFKWLSADDKLKKNAVETLINEAKRLNGSQNSIICSYFDIIDEDNNFLRLIKESEYNNLNNFEQGVILLDHFYGNGITSLIHKSIFERAGFFNEDISFQEDYEFWLRCSILHGVTFNQIPKSLVQYRVHKNQLTSTKQKDGYENEKVIKKMVLDKLESDKRKLYLKALKKYRNRIPLKNRFKRNIKSIMRRLLPEDTYFKIISIYLKWKKFS